MSSREYEGDAGAPLPDLSARGISLETVAPALGVPRQQQPDYLDYDKKGRGLLSTMFANAGGMYLFGIFGGGVYGLQRGMATTPSSKFKVRLNSILNQCGRYGSKAGNTFGVFAVLYSLYEGLGDQLELDQMTGLEAVSPMFAAGMTGLTYYGPSGVRVAGLAGAIGVGAVGASYAAYTAMGKPYGWFGFLFL